MGIDYRKYYQRANEYAEKNLLEKALANYQIAFFVGRDSADRISLGTAFIQYRTGKKFNEHEMNIAVMEIIEELMKSRLYNEALEILDWLFFSEPVEYRKLYLSEETMLQYMMLESTLTEKNEINTCDLFDNSWLRFREAYILLKHAIRRILMGFEEEYQRYLIDVVKKYKISAEMIAVVTKYSTAQRFWVSIFNRIHQVLSRGCPEMALNFERFNSVIGRMTDVEQVECLNADVSNDLKHRRIFLEKNSVTVDEKAIGAQSMDSNKIAIIFCTNSEEMENECVLYLRHQKMPKDKTVEIISVWNAPGMCRGYNSVMLENNAKYKIYIHHDSFFMKDDILVKLIELFEKGDWKLLGIAGAVKMKGPFWWDADLVRYNMYQDRTLETILSQTREMKREVDEAEAVDGVLIATSEDVVWREDVFDEWHFYDISQCFEFLKRGFKVGLINDKEPWILHEATTKRDSEKRHEYYAGLFREMYTCDEWDVYKKLIGYLLKY